MQVRARPFRVWFGFRLTAHVLQVEVFQYDEIVLFDETGGGLVLPIVYDSVGFRVQSADFPAGALIGAARMLTVLFQCFAGHAHASRLCFLTAAYLPVDTVQPFLGKVDESVVGRGERVDATPVQSDHGPRAFMFYRQRIVDEHERSFRPVHPDARIVADGLADPDTDMDAVTA